MDTTDSPLQPVAGTTCTPEQLHLLPEREAALRQEFEITTEEVQLLGRRWEILRPGCVDDLLDEEAFARDERIPYWSELWASALVLVERMGKLREKYSLEALPPVLELGSGLGLVAAAARWLGFSVLATDYYEESLRFAWVNAVRNNVAPPETQMVDWRAMPPSLETFPLVIASDVLYEASYAQLVSGAIADTLSSDGVAWVTDPGRKGAASLPEECKRRGLTLQRVAQQEAAVGNEKQTVDTWRIWRR